MAFGFFLQKIDEFQKIDNTLTDQHCNEGVELKRMKNLLSGATVILLLMVISGCGEKFDIKYAENCKIAGLHEDEFCNCMATELNNSLSDEQKSLILNGTKNNDQRTLAVFASTQKPSVAATETCVSRIPFKVIFSLEKMNDSVGTCELGFSVKNESEVYFYSLTPIFIANLKGGRNSKDAFIDDLDYSLLPKKKSVAEVTFYDTPCNAISAVGISIDDLDVLGDDEKAFERVKIIGDGKKFGINFSFSKIARRLED